MQKRCFDCFDILKPSFQYTASSYLLSKAINPNGSPLFPAPIRNARFIPLDESQGLSRAEIGKLIEHGFLFSVRAEKKTDTNAVKMR
jgi:hypothetical protein